MRALPRRYAAAALLAGILLTPARPSEAHTTGPAKVVPVTAGSYRLLVSFYDDPPRTGRALAFAVDPAPGALTAGARLQVIASAVPGPRTNAVPVRVTVGPHEDGPGGVNGTIRFPVAGAWSLRLDVQTPAGMVRAEVPVRVEPPPAIPLWLGWLVGLVPLGGLAGFLAAQTWTTWRAGGFRLADAGEAGEAGEADGAPGVTGMTGVPGKTGPVEVPVQR